VKNKVVLVSGGTQGIGLSIANTFALDGYRVAVCARHNALLPNNITYFPCDVADKADIQRLADSIIEHYGVIDVLVNNAGLFIPGSIQDEDDSVLENLMRTNLYSAYYLTKRLLPTMIKNGGGTVINVCSTASTAAYSNGGAYAISKHALLGFSKCLRQETKAQNIRVLSVLPGATYTGSWDGSGVPEERMMPAQDVAKIIFESYKLSDRTVVEEILIRPLLGDIS